MVNLLKEQASANIPCVSTKKRALSGSCGMDILRKHREYVEEQRRKWDEYLENLDAKIGIYEEMIK